MAIGGKAIAKSTNSVAIGYNAKAGGQNSLAALGGVTGVWTGDVYTTGTGKNAVAIGEGAVAKADNSVAIGYYATANSAPVYTKGASGAPNIATTQFAVGGGTISYDDGEGAADYTVYAKITGVAYGVNDHDAVTKGQLDAAISGISVNMGSTAGNYYSANDGVVTAVTALDVQVKTNADAIAANKSILLGSATSYSDVVTSTTYANKGNVAGDIKALDTAISSLSSTASTHAGDTTVHITAADRITWNAKQEQVVAGSNIVLAADNKTIGLATSLTGMTSAQFSGNVSAGSVTVGDVKIESTGINAGNKKITNVADGTEASDAATVGQVNQLIGSVGGNFNELSGQVSRLGTRISKVGAGAAAMASMHPVYDEDSKLTFSAGLGSYRSEKAVAIGAFYRPNERVMVNLGSTMGNDDNMVGIGVNFALDRNVGTKLPSKAVMARQLTEQNEKLAEQDARIAEQDARIAKQDKENAEMKKQMMKMMAMINALKKK